MVCNPIEMEFRSDCVIAKTVRDVACVDNVEFVSETAGSSLLQSTRRMRAIKQPHVQGVVLAGGRSSRMGSDKALLTLGGIPLIQCAINTLCSAGLRVSISGSRADLGYLAPVLTDMEPSQGPLTGICSTLHALAEPWIVLVTVDMPLVPSSLVELMLEVAIEGNAAVVLPFYAGRLHPFPCVLHRDLLFGLASEHAAGRYGCLQAFSAAASGMARPVKALVLESLIGSGFLGHPHRSPMDAWLLNVNRPANLSEAERWIAAQLDAPVLSEGELVETGASQCLP
jgi:molybdenum cofactor guanylyltransferase